MPQPGTVNYVEGQVTLGGRTLTEQSVGSARLTPGETLATQNGRAEVLLTPGVMLRVDSNSAVLLDSTGLPDTVVAIQHGRAMVEADQVLSANHIVINEAPASVQIVTHGLYDFAAMQGTVRVFDGRAEVTVAGKAHTLQKGHQFDLNAPKLKARGFDKKTEQDAFYRWSSLRSAYLAEANADAARGFAQGYYNSAYGNSYSGNPYYAGYPGYYPYGYDYGWYWDPYFDAYTWLPWDGIFFSPFGWGFYSPAFVYAAPFYGRGGYGFRGGYHNFGPEFRPSVAPHQGGSAQIAGNGFRGGFAGGGMGGGGFAGGGFHGGGFGGGGFHGGGGGGRR